MALVRSLPLPFHSVLGTNYEIWGGEGKEKEGENPAWLDQMYVGDREIYVYERKRTFPRFSL